MGRFPNSPSFLLPLYWPQPLSSQTSRPLPPPSISTLTTRFSNKQKHGLTLPVGKQARSPTSVFHPLLLSTLSYFSKDEHGMEVSPFSHSSFSRVYIHIMSPAVEMTLLWMLCVCVCGHRWGSVWGSCCRSRSQGLIISLPGCSGPLEHNHDLNYSELCVFYQ